MKCFVLNGTFAPKPGYTLSSREQRDPGRAMRANQCFRDLSAAIEERPIPVPGADEVLIRMGVCGVCGSDMHAVRSGSDGYSVYGNHLRLPVILGHEFSGEVVKVGSDVTSVAVGDLIAVEQLRYCGKCRVCRQGLFCQCENMEEIGLSADGGFAEYIAVPERFCCSISDLAVRYGSKTAALEAGSMIEPIGVAYNGMFVASDGLKPGSHVVVYGAGPIGVAAVALAKTCGAAKILCIARTEGRLALARANGADVCINTKTLNPDETVSDIVLRETGGIGAAMVVEATGAHTAVMPEIERMIAPGGQVIALGVDASPAPVDLITYQRAQARIQGSLGTAGSDIFPSVIRLIASGRIDPLKMITARYPLAQAADAIAAAAQPGHGKVLVVNTQE